MPERKNYSATLVKAWNEYGHSIEWDDLVGVKIIISETHSYAALAWLDEGMIEYADLTSPDGGQTWEMQNDGGEQITKKQWQEARIKPGCDWLYNPNTGDDL